MISLQEVTKQFGKTSALSEVSLDFLPGKSYALLGPNGSGKTTLIKSILGLVIPTSGNILFNGLSIRNQCEYRNQIGYMPQTGHFPPNMRIGQLLDMMQSIRSANNTLDDDLIKEFNLYRMYDKPIHTLSGGTRQKVSAALAFLFNVPVLILDEPTAGLDPLSVEIVKEKIIAQRSAGKVLIITSHILSDLDELISNIVYIQDGKIQYNDTLQSLKQETQEKRLSKAIANWLGQQQFLSNITM